MALEMWCNAVTGMTCGDTSRRSWRVLDESDIAYYQSLSSLAQINDYQCRLIARVCLGRMKASA